jgi:hypothetical protein
MLRKLRWLLILPAAIAAWYLALVVGIALLASLAWLCAPDKMVFERCTAPWYGAAADVLVCFGAGLAAVLILLVSTWLAPTQKPRVAVWTFTLGCLVAAFMGIGTGMYAALIAAIAIGALGLWAVLHRLNLPRQTLPAQ